MDKIWSLVPKDSADVYRFTLYIQKAFGHVSHPSGFWSHIVRTSTQNRWISKSSTVFTGEAVPKTEGNSKICICFLAKGYPSEKYFCCTIFLFWNYFGVRGTSIYYQGRIINRFTSFLFYKRAIYQLVQPALFWLYNASIQTFYDFVLNYQPVLLFKFNIKKQLSPFKSWWMAKWLLHCINGNPLWFHAPENKSVINGQLHFGNGF